MEHSRHWLTILRATDHQHRVANLDLGVHAASFPSCTERLNGTKRLDNEIDQLRWLGHDQVHGNSMKAFTHHCSLLSRAPRARHKQVIKDFERIAVGHASDEVNHGALDRLIALLVNAQ